MYPNSLKLVQAIFLVLVLLVECVQQVPKWRETNVSMSCIDRERRALLELKQGLVDHYGLLSSWGQDGDPDCCKWWGVECNNQTGHVQKLDLHAVDPEQPVKGEIRASLMDLQYLTFLDFSWNDFDGRQIPEFIGSLTNLIYIDLSHAPFSGKIPHQLGKLPNLQVLNLRRNYLVGGIPYQLGNLSNLRQLQLCFNHLSCTIPYQIGNLSRLETLNLGPNDNLLIDIQSPMDIEWISHLSSLADLALDNVSNLKKSKNWLLMIGQLPDLRVLSFTNCSLSDMDLQPVPPSKLNFSLTVLYLDFNKFTSSIFSWLFHLNSSLADLTLEANLLEGPIPNDLGRKMNSLQSLNLRNNQLSGTIPKTMALLSELRAFYVEGNSLEGEITNLVHFANLTKLKFLELSHNSLNLKFTDDWIPHFQLKSFQMQSCTLGPYFPKWLETQKDLFLLDVPNVGISDTETVASFLCFAGESLRILNISSNHLKGTLSDCWSHLSSLRILDLSNNEFFGDIPNSMSSLLLIRHLILRNNHFTGQLPSFKNCANLVMLDVGQNEILGPVPSWIASNLNNLQVLSLRKNNFYGSLPLDLCHLTSIQVLDLSHNNLCGEIPKCLKNFSAMAHKPSFFDAIDEIYMFRNGTLKNILDYDFYPTVRWKGKELSFKDNQRLLKLIDLSSNQLFGKIPNEIGSLSELISLDLSRNNLSGQIPLDLRKLHALEFLDLSQNHLYGKIPSSLSELSWLAVLNLSHNNLSGKIPSGTQLQGFDTSVYNGNPFLCGSPLKRLCPDENKFEGSSNFQKHEEEDDNSYFTQGFYISMGLGFATGFWVIFGSLLIFRSWRHAYFTFLSSLFERIAVVMIINVARCRMLLER